MMHPTFSAEMMFGSHHKSHNHPYQPLLLRGQLDPRHRRGLIGQWRESDDYPNELQ